MSNKFFIDTEFLEGPQKRLFGYTKPTIDFISIGIVDEVGRDYYAVSKDFNLKEAWNRYDEVINKHFPDGPEYNRLYWIRENVLKPIFYDLVKYAREDDGEISYEFNYRNFKTLLNKYGKGNKTIAQEILSFVGKEKPVFYGYYADYDWVVFCWLYGRMIDLPSNYPMYCTDLKQMYDIENAKFVEKRKLKQAKFGDTTIHELKDVKSYPKNNNEHNALADAKWNKELYKFLDYKA